MSGGDEETEVEDKEEDNFSDIFQGDGADTISVCNSDDINNSISVEEESEGAIPVLNAQTKNRSTQEETTPVWFDHYEPLNHTKK